MAKSKNLVMPKVSKSNRAMVFTHFGFHNVINDVETPIPVVYRQRAGLQNIKSKKDGSDVTANIISGEEAYLNSPTDMLRVRGSFAVIPVVKKRTYHFSEGDADVISALEKIFVGLGDDHTINNEVFALYARNILNGSWLWRNLTESATTDISVDIEDPRAGVIIEENVDDVNTIANYMWDSFSGVSLYRFNLTADVKMAAGGGAPVYPTQEFVDGSKQLLKINGDQAAFRDTKVWNAIRTIDTWYPDYNEYLRPIAVETLGANKDLGVKLRIKNSFVDIILRAVKNGLDSISHEDKLYCAAVIHRGSVYQD